MDDHADMPPSPPNWLEAIERGEADRATGRVVSAEELLEELRASNLRMMSRLDKKAPNAA